MNMDLKGVACLVANSDELPGTRSEKFKRAWISVRKIWAMVDPDKRTFVDAGICPDCRQFGYLLEVEPGVFCCLNCGVHLAPYALDV